MDNGNIPFGYNDNGEYNIQVVYGNTKSTLKKIAEQEAQEEKERAEREYLECAPQTPEEANLWFIKQRRRTPEQQQAEDKRIQAIRDSLK